MSNPEKTSKNTNPVESAQFLAGLKAFLPQTAIERSIYYCTDTKEYYRFESGTWKVTTR